MAAGAVKAAGAVEQVAAPGTGPGEDGGGPPISVEGHVDETSENAPKAARQGSETRRIRGTRVR